MGRRSGARSGAAGAVGWLSRASFLIASVAALVAGFLAYLVGPGSSAWLSNTSWTIAAVVAVAGVASARRRSNRAGRNGWLLLLVACVAWLVGQVLFFIYSYTGFPADPNVPDVCWLMFAALGGLAFSGLGWDLSEARARRMVEVALLVGATWALCGALLWRDIGASHVPAGTQAMALAYPLAYVPAGLLALQAGFSGVFDIRRDMGARLVVGGFAIEGLSFILWSPLLLSDSYAPGRSIVDILWTVGMVMIGGGARIAGPKVRAPAWQETSRARGGILPYVAFFALIGVQIFLLGDNQPRGAAIVLAAGMAFVAVNLSFRTWLVRLHELGLLNAVRAGEQRLREANAELERESRAREDMAEELRSVLDSAGEGIFGLDCSGRATFVNPATARMTGHSVAELVGTPLHSTLHHTHVDGSDYAAADCPILRPVVDGTMMTGEDVFWRRDGTSFPIHYTSMPLTQDGQINGAVVVFQDISERKDVERRKDEFTSIVSHELRTPLTAIRGSLGLMAGGALGEMPQKSQRMLDIAVENTDRLIRLINDILDIERIESGRVELRHEPVEVREAVRRTIESVRSIADQASVTITAEAEALVVHGDADRIIQALTNLLSNAVKFSPPGGVVRLTVARDGDDALFSVSDRGRGIPRDKLETVFGRFEQVDASDAREQGGTGLGLAICRSIVTQHGGRIWVESELGTGSTFRFTIPATAPPAAIDLDAPTEADISERPAIVVCDDDVGVRSVIIEMLDTSGYRAIPAVSGEHLMDILDRERPSAVVLDLVMAGLSGWEAISLLEQRLAEERLPLVVVTVLSREEAGPLIEHADAFLQKPIDPQALVAALDRALTPAPPRVLVVDDDEHLCDIICVELEAAGLEVAVARTGHEAIERGQRLKFDALVLDLALPGRDGFQVVEALRPHPGMHAIPLVVYSASELSAGDRARLTFGGRVEYLTKSRESPAAVSRRVAELVRTRALKAGRT